MKISVRSFLKKRAIKILMNQLIHGTLSTGLVKNVENNNGKVGIFGISYPGFYSTMGIINAHPAVKAVSPQAPVTAWFIGDDFHHNGAFFLLDCFSFYYSNGQPHQVPTRRGFPSSDGLFLIIMIFFFRSVP